jgi:hypothetical protein
MNETLDIYPSNIFVKYSKEAWPIVCYICKIRGDCDTNEIHCPTYYIFHNIKETIDES